MGSQSQEGRSVATMWAEMVKAAEGGEVVGIANKHGDDVAVMLSTDHYETIVMKAAEWDKSQGIII